MIGEFYVPELQPEDLIQQLQQEITFAQAINNQPINNQLSQSAFVNSYSPSISSISVPLAIDLSGTKDLINAIKNLVEIAQSRAVSRQSWPESFNRFPLILLKPLQIIFFPLLNLIFKDQKEVNHNLIQALNQLLLLNESLLGQINILRSQCHTDLQQLSVQDSKRDRRWQVGIDQYNDKLQRQLQEMNDHYNNYIDNLQKKIKQMENEHESVVQNLEIVKTRSKQDHHHLDLLNLQMQSLDEQMKKSDQRNFRDISFLKNDLTQQKRLITLSLEEDKPRINESSDVENLMNISSDHDEHNLDAFYVAFEQRFRGSEELITERLKVYLPLLEESGLDTAKTPILDVGCGRGEWLSLLKNYQYTAKGLDLNRVMVEECCEKDLQVEEANVVSYLESLPEGSLGCITGFHIIEHLPFPSLMRLFQEAYRVLCSGGMVIFETPNPNNVRVSSWSFYFDPTHHNPLPSPLTEFLAEFTGFEKVRILNLHPDMESQRLSGLELADRFNDYFYGPQDYAVIGYKP